MALLVNVDPAVARTALEPTVREDLTDRIINASPADTVKWQMLGRVGCTQPKFDWINDNLNHNEDVDTTTLQNEVRFENQDWGNFRTIQARKRLFNYCEIQSEEVDVSATILASTVAGTSNELTTQTTKAYKELGVKMEKHLSWGRGDAGDDDQDGAATSKRRTQGMYTAIAMSGLGIAHGTANSKIDYTTTVGGHSAPTNVLTLERSRNCNAHFRDLAITTAGASMTLDQLYTEIIQPAVRNGFIVQDAICFVGLMGRMLFGRFASETQAGRAVINQRNISAEAMRIVDRIDSITTPYGTFFIAFDRQLEPRDPTKSVTFNAADYSSDSTGGNHTAPRNECFFMVQPAYFRNRILRGVHYQNLPNVSDGVKVGIVTEWGHEFSSLVYGCGAMNYWAPAA